MRLYLKVCGMCMPIDAWDGEPLEGLLQNIVEGDGFGAMRLKERVMADRELSQKLADELAGLPHERRWAAVMVLTGFESSLGLFTKEELEVQP